MAKFVKMVKEGQTIDVSPLTVKSHEKAGWKLVEPMSDAQLEESKLEASKAAAASGSKKTSAPKPSQ